MSGEAEPALGHRVRQSQPSDIGRGGACPHPSGKAEPALGRRAGRRQPSAVERGGVYPQTSGEAELALVGQAERNLSPWGSGEAEPIFRRSGKKCSSVLV